MTWQFELCESRILQIRRLMRLINHSWWGILPFVEMWRELGLQMPASTGRIPLHTTMRIYNWDAHLSNTTWLICWNLNSLLMIYNWLKFSSHLFSGKDFWLLFFVFSILYSLSLMHGWQGDQGSQDPVAYDNGVTYMFVQHNNVYLMTASRQNCNAASLLLFLHRVVDVSAYW